MEYLFSNIKEFDGIIGALLGVITTMLMNEYLKSKGKIKYYFDNIDIRYMGTEESGFYQEFGKEKDYEAIEYTLNIQIYNTSESRKILRDIKIQLISGEFIEETIPIDSSKTRSYAGGSTCGKIKIININPKEILEIKIDGYISNCDINVKNFKNIDKVYMLAKDSDDKIIKKLIKDYQKTS